MKVTEISIIPINFNNLKPEDVFKWLEEFGFHRYGVRHHIDPSKSDDPRYPREYVTSPAGLYTSVIIPKQYYDEDIFIIRNSEFEEIKTAFLSSSLKVKAEK